jgi:hypothetical protein
MEINKKQYLDVRVSMDQLIKRLEDCFVKNLPNRSLIAETIINNLVLTEMGLSHLYNAFSGIKPYIHVKIDDEVLVPWDSLPTWRLDKKLMMEKGYLIKKDYVRATIKSIDLSKRDSIEIEYKYPNSSSIENEELTGNFIVRPDVVFLINDELPENLADGF